MVARWLGMGEMLAARRARAAKEEAMATNKPTGDNARKGAVRKRSQLKTKIEGEETWTKRQQKLGPVH